MQKKIIPYNLKLNNRNEMNSMPIDIYIDIYKIHKKKITNQIAQYTLKVGFIQHKWMRIAFWTKIIIFGF